MPVTSSSCSHSTKRWAIEVNCLNLLDLNVIIKVSHQEIRSICKRTNAGRRCTELKVVENLGLGSPSFMPSAIYVNIMITYSNPKLRPSPINNFRIFLIVVAFTFSGWSTYLSKREFYVQHCLRRCRCITSAS